MVIEQLMLRLPLAHTRWSVDNIVRNLAMPAQGEPGRVAHIIMFAIWMSILGVILIVLFYAMIQMIRGKLTFPSMFAPPPRPLGPEWKSVDSYEDSDKVMLDGEFGTIGDIRRLS